MFICPLSFSHGGVGVVFSSVGAFNYIVFCARLTPLLSKRRGKGTGYFLHAQMFVHFSNKFIFNGIRRDASVATSYFYKYFCPAKTPVSLVFGGGEVGERDVGTGGAEVILGANRGVFGGGQSLFFGLGEVCWKDKCYVKLTYLSGEGCGVAVGLGKVGEAEILKIGSFFGG